MADDELRDRVEELSKMRSTSASPSTISTASSGSPLVRGSSSGGSNKRPAATSIAAAQLACQQQQLQRSKESELEFSNKLASPMKSSKHSARANKLSSVTRQHQQAEDSHRHQSGGDQYAKSKQFEKSSSIGATGDDGNKGFGYNLAKSVAFRVYRFNDFWSVNKLRYMNLACLLMTLVCLVTILLFSGSSGGSSGTSGPVGSLPLVTRVSGKRSSFSADSATGDSINSEADETIDSLDSQPLIRSSRDQQKLHNNGADGFDDKTESPPQTGGGSGSDEREREDITTTTTSSPSETNEDSQQFRLFGGSHHNHHHRLPVEFGVGPPPASFVGPILNELLNDMDFGSLFKSIRNRTLANGRQPTIVRKLNKNGATIIISSSGGALNESNPLNESMASPFPSLLEKLLPPTFGRPIKLDGSSGNETDQPMVSATITINAEPIFSQSSPMSSMMFPSRFMDSIGPFGMPPPPSIFGSPHSSDNPFRSIFSSGAQDMEPPMGLFSEGQPSFMMAPPPPHHHHHHHSMMPPHGLMSMIMRANSIMDEEPNEVAPGSGKNGTQIEGQASQQVNATVASDQQLASNKSSSATTDPDVETFDVTQLPKFVPPTRSMHTVYGPRPRGSMVILTSSSSGLLPFRLRSSGFSGPFGQMSESLGSGGGGALPQMFMQSPFGSPHMILMGGLGRPNDRLSPLDASPSPINPLLRAMLGSVAAGFERATPSESPLANKTNSSGKASSPAIASRRSSDGSKSSSQEGAAQGPAAATSAAASWSDVDDEWAPADPPAGGPEESSRNLRANHRMSTSSSANDDDDQAEAAEFITGLQMDQQSPQAADLSTLMSGSGSGDGFISGTIRRTIRGPGVTVERTYEFPSEAQQVGAGVRSQSLSRADFDESDDHFAGSSLRPFFPLGHQNRRVISSQASSDEYPVPPPVGLIGRLLADLSRRASESQQPKSRSSQDSSEDLEGGESGPEDSRPSSPKSPMKVFGPSFHVASARLRMRPSTSASSAQEDSFLVPPAHFRLPIPSEEVPLAELNKPANGEPDTLSSVEDRLNNVLTAASSQSQQLVKIANHRAQPEPAATQVQSSARSPAEVKPLVQQQQPGQQAQHSTNSFKPLEADSPFTSPSSPLFGFPMQAAAATTSQSAPRPPTMAQLVSVSQQRPAKEIEIVVANSNTNQSANQANRSADVGAGINRKQRSFTYHSNHELAKPVAATAANLQASNPMQTQPRIQTNQHHHQQSQYLERANRMVDESLGLPPPADVVMGRRVDDSPSELNVEDFTTNHHNGQRQAREVPAAVAQISAKVANDNEQRNYRTIVI